MKLPDPTPCEQNAWPGVALLCLFAIERGIFYHLGGTFLDAPLRFAMQYLDPALLQNQLLPSIFYLHSQPPLFNLFLGAVLKVSPDPGLSFEICFRTLGALLPLLLYGTLSGLGLRSLTALIVTALFMLNPTVLLYESLLYYTFVEAVLVLGALFFLQQWVARPQGRFLVLLWACLTGLGLVRSLFHPLFFAGLTIVAGAAAWKARLVPRAAARQFILCGAICTGLVCLPAIKNLAVYGFFGTSSWDGMSLWTKANGFHPDQLEDLHAAGILSDTALQAGLKAFKPLTAYYTPKEQAALPCHVPADCQVEKSTGYPNFNHIGYVNVSRQLARDARHLIAHDPGLFAFYTLGSFSLTLWHSSDSVHGLFQYNMEILQPLERLYRFAHFEFLGVRSKHQHPGMWVRTGVIAALLLLLYCVPMIGLLRGQGAYCRGVLLVGLVCVMLHAWTVGVSSVVEFGENNRFRFPVDAAAVVLAGAVLVQVRLWWQNR